MPGSLAAKGTAQRPMRVVLVLSKRSERSSSSFSKPIRFREDEDDDEYENENLSAGTRFR